MCENKGYFEHLTRQGKARKESRNKGKPRKPNLVGLKDYNSSIHLLEALTLLYEVWPDSLLRERFIEMLYIIRDKIVTAKGYMHLFFKKDWSKFSYNFSIKHPLFSEIKQVLSRPWLAKKYHILTEQRDQLLWRLRRFSHFVSHLPKLKPIVKEDPADDVILATAVAARAEVIVSGDEHLQKLKEYRRISIVSPKDFLEIIKRL